MSTFTLDLAKSMVAKYQFLIGEPFNKRLPGRYVSHIIAAPYYTDELSEFWKIFKKSGDPEKALEQCKHNVKEVLVFVVCWDSQKEILHYTELHSFLKKDEV